MERVVSWGPEALRHAPTRRVQGLAAARRFQPVRLTFLTSHRSAPSHIGISRAALLARAEEDAHVADEEQWHQDQQQSSDPHAKPR